MKRSFGSCKGEKVQALIDLISANELDFLKVRFGIRTFPACFARFLPTYIVVGGWPWCDWGCVIILANEKRIFK